MMNVSLVDNFYIFLLLYSISHEIITALEYELVTCGTVLKLLNSYHDVRLHSHEVKYGSGSGQQSVTAIENSDDHNSYWQVKGEHNSICTRGQPVKCGQTIRLMHVSTRKNLHSHHFTSPLSNNYEVSAFGNDGTGDDGDQWVVVCSGKNWSRSERFRLKHINTDAYLHVTGDTFGRPIHGQKEVCTIRSSSSGSFWRTAEGIFIKPTERDFSSSQYGYDHDEF